MTPIRGRAICGQRLVEAVPHNHYLNLTTVSAFNLEYGHIISGTMIGPMTGDLFEVYLEYFLGPYLKPGQIVLMDNLSSHKVAGVKEIIESTGADLMYLPPYSPDYQPAENAISKIKTLVRKAKARTVDAVIDAVAKATDAVTSGDMFSIFKDLGYG